MIAQITEVWQALVTFLTTMFEPVTEFFYNGEALTFAGTMAVVMAGIGLVLLVFNLIRSFLPMRG